MKNWSKKVVGVFAVVLMLVIAMPSMAMAGTTKICNITLSTSNPTDSCKKHDTKFDTFTVFWTNLNRNDAQVSVEAGSCPKSEKVVKGGTENDPQPYACDGVKVSFYAWENSGNFKPGSQITGEVFQ